MPGQFGSVANAPENRSRFYLSVSGQTCTYFSGRSESTWPPTSTDGFANEVAASRDGATQIQEYMEYAADGTRRSTRRANVTSYENWEDGLGGDAEILTQGREAYIYGPGGMALERVQSDGVPRLLWQDALGSITAATTLGGGISGVFTYDAWGRRLVGFGNQAGTLGFAGEVTEPDLDLQYLRARYYDVKTASFLTRDPQEASTGQPYLYAAGNPTMYTDPSGESIVDRITGTFDRVTGGGTANVRRALNGGCDPQDTTDSDYRFAGDVIEVTAEVVAFVGSGGVGKVASVAGKELYGAGATARAGYNRTAAGIPEVARVRLLAGDSLEAAGRGAVSARDALKISARAKGPASLKLLAEATNLIRYRNRVGPSYEWLVARKSIERIIEGAGRTNPRINRFFGQ